MDPRQKEDSLDRCEVNVEDRPDQAAYRFKFKMIYMHGKVRVPRMLVKPGLLTLFDIVGVTKTYQLTYESVESMHALFDRNRATNQWKIQARLLREYVEYFAPKTEQLDIYPEEGRCTLLSFTEKIMRGKGPCHPANISRSLSVISMCPHSYVRIETLKQPLQTAVSIDLTDFIEFNAAENLHIVINVKDFRNMVIHAETLKTIVAAAYSQPGRPLQFSYSAFGMRCEFTLMTIGESSNAATQGASRASTREPPPRQASASVSGSTLNRSHTEMPPPQRPASRTTTETTRRLGSRAENQPFHSQPDPDPESLFLPDEDDRQWEPVENLDAEDMLGWDASLENVSFNWQHRLFKILIYLRIHRPMGLFVIVKILLYRFVMCLMTIKILVSPQRNVRLR